MKRFHFLFIFLILSLASIIAKEKLIYKIDIKKEIGATTWLYLQKGMKEALRMNADLVLIHMNTYGGEVLYADSIRTSILNSKIPVDVFIDNNAASAGALISIACDKIYMRPGANIGAATVVNGTDGKAMPDKYQSYMRATIRATAEAQGKDTVITAGGDTILKWRRDPLIAEAMVDSRVRIAGITDSGKVLTFTAQEALKNGYCNGIVESVDELLLSELHTNEYTIQTYTPSLIDDLKGFLMSTVVQSVLIMIIIGGIYYELQSPGIGFPLAAAVGAAILYFSPLVLDGLAAYWEILLFIVGLLLLIIEIFVLPGFGVAGISGIIVITASLILSMLANDLFNFDKVSENDASRSILTVSIALIGSFVLIIYLFSKMGSGIFRKLALESSQDIDKGFLSVSQNGFDMVDKVGESSTMLRPSGKVMIDDTIYDAIALVGYIEKGVKVRVVRYESGQLYVKIEKDIV